MTQPAADAIRGPPAPTRLITDRSERAKITSYREVDVRSAVARGLVEYLQGKTIEMPGGRRMSIEHAYPVWPEGEQEAIYPAITAVPEGAGDYDRSSLVPAFDPADRIARPDNRWPFKWAELTQEVRLELHTNDPMEREGLTALIEDAFAPVDWMMGFKLELPFYFGVFAQYEPLRVGYPDDAQTALERLRVTYFYVNAHVPVLVLRDRPNFKPAVKVIVDGVLDPSFVSTFSAPAPGPRGHELDANAMLLCRFDEAASTDALVDITGNVTFVEHAEPAVVVGQVDGARQFASAPPIGPQHTNRYFDGPLTDDQKTALDAEWSWEQWVFLDSTSEGTFGNSNDPMLLLGNISIFIDASTHKLKVDWPTDHEFAPDHVLPIDAWMHVAVTVAINGGDATKRDLKLYVNGVEVASAAALRHPSSIGDTWSVGGPLNGEFWPGSLDDCRVSNVCRSGAAVLDSYNRGL